MKKRVLIAICFSLLCIPLLSQVPDVQTDTEQKKNLLGFGYQVGGQTLIGVDYSWRFSRILGIHFGAGLSGYAGGINFYLSSKYTSTYININYEDGGFGLISLVTAKWNGLFGLDENKQHGLYYNVGIAKILSIDSEFKETLFGDEDIEVFPTISIGYGFRL